MVRKLSAELAEVRMARDLTNKIFDETSDSVQWLMELAFSAQPGDDRVSVGVFQRNVEKERVRLVSRVGELCDEAEISVPEETVERMEFAVYKLLGAQEAIGVKYLNSVFAE